MNSLTPTQGETARKIASLILQRLSSAGQGPVAAQLGISESTISRHKDEMLTEFSQLLAVLGLKVVSADRVCVQEQEYLLMTRIVSRALANEESARHLLFEGPD